MVRTPSFDKNGIKKGAWSFEEDEILRAHILNHGHGNWRELPRVAGLKRCGKSCRLRWMNYLRPDLKHGNYTKEEEDVILQLHEQHGNKWAMIASKLEGRSDNEIKNHWHTHLKKRVIQPQKPANNTKNSKLSIDNHIVEYDTCRKNPIVLCGDHIQILESCPLSSSGELAPSSTTTSSCDISRSSPFEITTSSLDDGGLEEMLNSSELFAEMSSLISPYSESESVDQETPMITIDDVRRELLEDDDYFWGVQPFSEMYNNEQVLSSSPISYLDESFIDGLFLEQTIQEMLMP